MSENSEILLGCIADDFTGGSDAASFLEMGGLNTVLISEIPNENFILPPDCEAVVIALKSRTQETSQAVKDSLDAIRKLKSWGAKQFYFKYCSTFDSTDQGNIGPVTDAIMEELKLSGTILCPALPANGRTVRDGVLYVNGVPLSESSMRNHPLTPMKKSRIMDLMALQGKHACLEIHKDELSRSKESIDANVNVFSEQNGDYYIIPDYEDDEDAENIVEKFGDMRFLTGGSGILKALGKHIKGSEHSITEISKSSGKAIIVAGSCSVATHRQTQWFEKQGGYSIRLQDERVLSGEQNPEELWKELCKKENQTVLVYSYASPEELAVKRNEDGRKLSAKIEDTLSGVATLAKNNGYKRIIAAGGETSGAVTKSLGFRAFRIGPSIAPGVPVLIPLEDPDIRLVLKSGNFGQEDFFTRALRITEEGELNG